VAEQKGKVSRHSWGAETALACTTSTSCCVSGTHSEAIIKIQKMKFAKPLLGCCIFKTRACAGVAEGPIPKYTLEQRKRGLCVCAQKLMLGASYMAVFRHQNHSSKCRQTRGSCTYEQQTMHLDGRKRIV